MTVTLPDSSREYVEVKVSGPVGVDLTSLDVDIAVVPRSDTVVEGDWKTAEWVPGSTNRARLLVGPGSPFGPLVPASYSLWVRVVSGAEEPVRHFGILVVVPTE